MKVYVVTFVVTHEGSDIEGIFSTLEKAEEYVDSLTKYGPIFQGTYYDIDEFEIDKPRE